MRTYLSILLAGVLIFSVLTVGGCVPQMDYDRAVAANRRANEELLSCQKQLEDIGASTGMTGERLREANMSLAAKEDQIASLENENELLNQRMAQLSERVAALSASADQPPYIEFKLPGPVHEALKAFAETNSDLAEYMAEYGMVKFKADLTFEKGSDTATEEAQEVLEKFVAIMNSPDAGNFNIYVAGHTDDIPILKSTTRRKHPNNWYLSVHRAVAVQQILTKSGLAPERIGAMGFSEYHPVAANAPSKKGNRTNRRVEIWIVPASQFLTASSGAAETEVDEGK